jgi:ADP-dependent NAD(P)H-hydrate dehydratase / NAD(P)H-hydrate epimerase
MDESRSGTAGGVRDDSGAAVAEALSDDVVAGLLPIRDPRGHKGTYGRLLVVAGSLDYAGAALLVARAAGRTGAGLVRLAVPTSLQPVFAGRVVEVTTLGLPETGTPGDVDPARAVSLLADLEHDALVVGPGLKPGASTRALVAGLLACVGGGAVVDAEALNSLALTPSWWDAVRRPCVLTPHVGEFGRLRPDAGRTPPADLAGDDDARLAAARDAARAWGQVVVLKGARTVIAAPEGRASRAPFENPALASAGTGDVLSGAIGSLLAQGLEPFDAARAGVYLHGVAGDAVRERFGDAGLLASDLLDEMARVRSRLTLARARGTGRGRLGFALERARAAGQPIDTDT